MTDTSMSFTAMDEGHYRGHVPALDVLFDADRLHRDRAELHGELTVLTGLVGARVVDGAVLSSATFNFSSLRGRKERAADLAERAQTGSKVDWRTLLEDFCHRILAAERAGTPAVMLHEVPKPAPDVFHDVDGWKLPKTHPSVGFGDGGTGKSLIALYFAGRLAQMGLAVGYFDWELSAAEHRARLESLFGEDMPTIVYVRCDRPLVQLVDHLKDIRRDHGLEFAIFDSVAVACDGPPEAAEVAAGYFRAVRRLGDGFGSLHLAHVAKAEGSDQKPFGSAFWHNLARSTWYFKAGEDVGATRTVALYCRKSNLSRLSPPVGLGITYADNAVTITRADLTQSEEFAPTLSLSDRIDATLRYGKPLKIHQIANELGAKADSIEKALKRNKKRFVQLPADSDGVLRWALRAKDHEVAA